MGCPWSYSPYFFESELRRFRGREEEGMASHESQVPRTPESSEPGQKPAGSESEGSERRRVLLIDNDPGVMQVIETMLKEYGLDVDCVPSAEAGLKALETSASSDLGQSYGAVMLDLRMPGMGGLGFLEEVRERNAPPVIVLSGYISVEDRRRIDSHVIVDSVFEKPFDLIDLATHVLRIVGEGSPGQRALDWGE
ncbi:MAG: hypothetical protein CSA62_10505 [Planctomycetota bacterium]|nr:MAG: hypothetical protein CSA62_10505 [Planctomycetota bacterium]